jgi:aminoglycoside phosphotransferase (APT) family kinase protein
LVHNDLGPEHVLVDEETTLPIELIDFESAWVGDPAIDFVGLMRLA